MSGVDAQLVKPLQAIAADPEGRRLLNAARAAGLWRIKVGALPQYVMGEAYAGTITISPNAFNRPADVVHALAHELVETGRMPGLTELPEPSAES